MHAHVRLELEIETKAVGQAIKHGYKTFKLNFIGRRGAPDRFFGRDGDCVLIEFKREGAAPTAQQMRMHDTLRRVFGLRVRWTDNYAEACNILGIPE